MQPCILTADLLGGPSRRASAPGGEAGHLLERCHHRMEMALGSHHGTLLKHVRNRLCARLECADDAVLAACEMIERVYTLPPAHGAGLGVRIGICLLDPALLAEAQALSARLATRAMPATALLGAGLASTLSAPTRQFAGVSSIEHRDPASALAAVLRHESLAGVDPVTRLHLRLRVHHQGHTRYVDAQNPRLLLGREAGNDLVLDNPHASRHHARIDFREHGFTFIDHSRNGSWVAAPGNEPVFVKDNETPLPGQGRIGLGQPGSPGDSKPIEFEIH